MLGIAASGLQPGCRADLVVTAADSVPEAVASHPERLLVVHGVRVVAPASEYARDSLSGRARTPMREAQRVLAAPACNAAAGGG